MQELKFRLCSTLSLESHCKLQESTQRLRGGEGSRQAAQGSQTELEGDAVASARLASRAYASLGGTRKATRCSNRAARQSASSWEMTIVTVFFFSKKSDAKKFKLFEEKIIVRVHMIVRCTECSHTKKV